MRAAKVGLALLVLVMLSSVVGPAIAVNKRANEKLKLPEELTKEELLQLYRKYNITENDIKFAKGELPHYLEGTILYGKIVTMGKVIKKGNKIAVQNWIDPKFYRWAVENGYKVVNATDYFEIEEKARKEYIRKYGVDPKNPKVDIVNGVPLPKEYVAELIKNGRLDMRLNGAGQVMSSNPEGPYAKYGRLYLWIYGAADHGHKPVEPYLMQTLDAYFRFRQFGPSDLYYYHVTDYWDASDVSPYDNSSKLLDDLKQDTDWVRYHHNDGDPVNDIVIGWVKYADHNGRAYINGSFSVAATQASGEDWPHDSIAQHEISHNFNAPDRGWWPWEHPECIMNYWYAYWGTDKWDDEDWWIVYGNINGYWEQ